jgi:hypothetical protein
MLQRLASAASSITGGESRGEEALSGPSVLIPLANRPATENTPASDVPLINRIESDAIALADSFIDLTAHLRANMAEVK